MNNLHARRPGWFGEIPLVSGMQMGRISPEYFWRAAVEGLRALEPGQFRHFDGG